MRITSVLPLALPLLASAQQQIPFIDSAKNLLAQAQGFLAGGSYGSMSARASASVSSAGSYASNVASNAADAAAGAAHGAARPVTAGVANAAVHELTLDNWKQTLVHSGSATPGSPAEPWFVGITGKNRTCGGLCDKFDLAWDVSLACPLVSDIRAPCSTPSIPPKYRLLTVYRKPRQSSPPPPMAHISPTSTATNKKCSAAHGPLPHLKSGFSKSLTQPPINLPLLLLSVSSS